MAEENLTRLNKYLSEVGHCSRRQADSLIEKGLVTVNGRVPEMGTKVSPNDEIRVEGRRILPPEKEHVYLAFNKPAGVVCTTDQSEKGNIIDFIGFPSRIFPVGRLDKASEGLILLTDDGDIVNKILRARNNHEKEYIVQVDRPVNTDFVARMGSGIPILDTVTRKCQVEQTGKYVFRIVLTQGLNRQIRRMCEYLGYQVVRLKRVRIMNIKLDVDTGRYRHLTSDELKELNRLTDHSEKVEPGKDSEKPANPSGPGRDSASRQGSRPKRKRES